MNLSLTHGALSTLSQHTAVNFHIPFFHIVPLQHNAFVISFNWFLYSCGEEAIRLRDVDGRPERPSSVTRVRPRFKPFHPLINLSSTHGALSTLSQHMAVNFHWFNSLCPQGNRTTPRCSAMVQSCKGASMFSPSLLPLD